MVVGTTFGPSRIFPRDLVDSIRMSSSVAFFASAVGVDGSSPELLADSIGTLSSVGFIASAVGVDGRSLALLAAERRLRREGRLTRQISDVEIASVRARSSSCVNLPRLFFLIVSKSSILSRETLVIMCGGLVCGAKQWWFQRKDC